MPPTPARWMFQEMQVFEIGAAEILFVVHPNSPASGISEDQMLAILTGEIDNWAAVGGPDAPINVVVEVPGNGTRAVVQSVFMDGADFAASSANVSFGI